METKNNTRNFEEIIARVIEKGAEKVEIHRSTAYCGCVNPGDIIAVMVWKNNIKFRVALCRVFDEIPQIIVYRYTPDGSNDWEIKRFDYKKN